MTSSHLHPDPTTQARALSRKLTEDPSAWRRDTTILLLVLSALTVLFSRTAASLVTSWKNDPLGHGFIIIPAVGYLAWQRRQLLKDFAPRSEWLAICFVSACAFAWFVGNLSDSVSLQQLCFVAIVIGFVSIVLGSSRARVFVFPLGFLFFGLPLGNAFIPALQDLTANFVVKLLAFSGVPVLLQGHVISIPGAAWKVAEACSGINYLTASLALGYLYAGVTYRYWTHRVGFLVAAALVPLVANGLRVYGTILLAFFAGPQSVEGTRHYLFGWIVFSLMMAVLFITCGRWRERQVGAPPELTPDDVPVASFQKSSPVIRTAFALLLVGTAPVGAALLDGAGGATSGDVREPVVSLPWSVAAVTRNLWTTHSSEAGSQFVRTYQSGSHSVELYVGYYEPQRGGDPVGDPVNALSSAWWPTAQGTRSVTLNGQTFQARESHLESTSASLLVWSWYSIDATYTGSKSLARLLLARSRLSRTSRPAAVMAVAIDAGATPAAEVTLQDFLLHVSAGHDKAAGRLTRAPALNSNLDGATTLERCCNHLEINSCNCKAGVNTPVKQLDLVENW